MKNVNVVRGELLSRSTIPKKQVLARANRLWLPLARLKRLCPDQAVFQSIGQTEHFLYDERTISITLSKPS